MAKQIPGKYLQAIEGIVASKPDGVGIAEIQKELGDKLSRRTLQYRLNHLVQEGRLAKEGDNRWTRYKLPGDRGSQTSETDGGEVPQEVKLPLSAQGKKVQEYVQKPVGDRKPVGYQREFLDRYRPNETPYLSEKELTQLQKWGTAAHEQQPAGTYAKQMLTRLLIDLSWSSSRLEGNTYSLLDTKRLLDFGEEAEGKQKLEAQMILNHKDAIEFLVTSAKDIGFNRHTILNLHGLLANNLLNDASATGRLRHIVVEIERSAYHPLEVPQLIEECFDQILATAEAIKNPFEQAFFVMTQLPYLQPFDDVNKRVSRLAANIPFIKSNFAPLSFIDLPNQYYIEAILGVYELNDVSLLKDVFMWAYERSSNRYKAVRQSLGEPDPFRLRYTTQLREVIRTVILEQLGKKAAFRHIATWTEKNIRSQDREHFREMTEDELLGLHVGNFARYQIRPSEFESWQKSWAAL
ncbi:MAG: Fic family protein [Proteobacteria bacterium]|nr:Fic family protein [Pseudomonadota bacterium]